jgi:hypothetical protein
MASGRLRERQGRGHNITSAERFRSVELVHVVVILERREVPKRGAGIGAGRGDPAQELLPWTLVLRDVAARAPLDLSCLRPRPRRGRGTRRKQGHFGDGRGFGPHVRSVNGANWIGKRRNGVRTKEFNWMTHRCE